MSNDVKWTIYRCSPFYGYDKLTCEQLSGRCRCFLNQVNSIRTLDVNICELVVSCQNGTDDANVVEIKITNENDDWLDVILRVSEKQNKIKFTCITFLALRGTLALSEKFLSFLRKEFDSYINPITFSRQELLWMSFFESNQIETDYVTFIFQTPSVVFSLKKIQYKIKGEQCHQLQESILGNHEERINGFMDAITAHFFSLFKIHLSKCILSAVATSSFEISTPNTIEIHNTEAAKAIFNHLSTLLELRKYP